MEHLYLEDRETFITIPFQLFGDQWDGGSFLDYPERREYDTSVHKFTGAHADESKEASYAFYQTWLYLGLIAGPFLCQDVNEKFLRYDEDAGASFLTTINLAEVIDEWKASVEAMALVEKINAIMHSIACLRKVQVELQEINVPDIDDFIWEHVEVPTMGQNIRLAVSLLCDAFGQAIRSVITEDLEEDIEKYNSKKRSEEDALPFPLYGGFAWSLGSVFDEHMNRAFLCPTEQKEFRTSPPSYLSYLLSLPETNRFEGQHDNCTEDGCVGNNVDEKTYVTKHVTPDCECEHDGPNVEDVKKCLKDGHIPSLTVSIVNGEYQGMQVKPQKAEKPSIWRKNQNKAGLAKSLDYVALSHVWSDGLGNPFANTLPRCQLKRLAYYVNYTMNDGKPRGLAESFDRLLSSKTKYAERHGSVWEQDGTFSCSFWNDTMCVPLQKEYRMLAIKSMNQVYRQARYVMVLDQCLAIHDYRTNEELMGRVVLSNWMRRVWTLQEAVLGMEKLTFCTRDKVVDHNDIVEQLRLNVVKGDNPIKNAVSEVVAILGNDSFQSFLGAVGIMEYGKGFSWSTFSQSRSKSRLLEAQYSMFMDGLWMVISRRATTKEEDRVLVACNILFKDVEKVLKGKGHTGRMTGLLSQLEEVSAEVIFKSGERVPVDGFRWACHNFKTSCWGKVDLQNPGIVTPEGLMVHWPGIILPTKPEKSSFPLILESDGEGEFFMADCTYPHDGGRLLSQDDWDKIAESSHQLAIIIGTKMGFTHTVLLKDGGAAPCRLSRAVLVSITGERKGTFYCKYEASMFYKQPPGLEYEPLVAKSHPTITIPNHCLRPASQRWCVG